jgi:glycosyltransferase involved in cell wall biosynthesis
MENLVSVIVPVYNAEKFLSRCIQSILNQTYKNFELILVDDGSTDDSAKIIEKFSKTDGRIVALKQKNSGVSSARNAGLEIAKGEWIAFVDADDWIDADAYEILVKTALERQADLVLYQFKFESAEGNEIPLKSDETEREIFVQNEKFPWYRNLSWSMLIKRPLIFENSLRFPREISIGEDRCFSYSCYGVAKKIWSLPNQFYHYCANPESATRSGFSMKKFDDDVRSMNLLEEFLAERKIKKLKPSIFLRKVEIKTQCYFFPAPDFKKYRETFPEINFSSMFSCGLKMSVLNFFTVLHMDFVSRLILKLHEILKKSNR